MVRSPLIALGVLLVCIGSASGQSDLMRLLGPPSRDPQTTVKYQGTYHPAQDVEAQDTDLSVRQHSLSVVFSAPITPRDEWLASVSVGYENVDTTARFPDTLQGFPEDLWEMKGGLGYRHFFSKRHLAGLSFSLGSSSDEPFDSWDETSLSLNGFYRLPSGKKNAWVFAMDFLHVRTIWKWIPLPGFGYWFMPSKEISVLVGIPVNMARVRSGPWTANLQYRLIRTIHAELGYRAASEWSVFAGFDWENRGYLPADRDDDDTKLFYYGKQVTSGIRYGDEGPVSIEGMLGYAFDRFYFQGEDYGDRDDDRIDVDNGYFGRIVARLRL